MAEYLFEIFLAVHQTSSEHHRLRADQGELGSSPKARVRSPPPARDKPRGVLSAHRAVSYLELKEPGPATATESPRLVRRTGAPHRVWLIDDLLFPPV